VSYENIVPTGVVLIRHIISQDNLRTGIIGVALAAEKLGHVLDILMATTKLILAAGIVDANEEGLLSDHD
jgi:hypothetical protein